MRRPLGSSGSRAAVRLPSGCSGTAPSERPGYLCKVGGLRAVQCDQGTAAAPPALICLTEDLINDARERDGGVDDNTVSWNLFFRLMQSRNDFPFRWPSAPLIFRSLLYPPVHCVKVDFQDKNSVKQIDEL